MMDARDGLQIGAVTYASVQVTPSEAKRSRTGVCTSACTPRPPRSAYPWSSETISRMFGAGNELILSKGGNLVGLGLGVGRVGGQQQSQLSVEALHQRRLMGQVVKLV